MCDKSIRLYSKSKSISPHQSSFADRQNGCPSTVPDFLSCLYYFYDEVLSSKVCLLYWPFHKHHFSSAGFSVVCDEVCNDWTEYQDAGGVIQVCDVIKLLMIKTLYLHRQDPRAAHRRGQTHPRILEAQVRIGIDLLCLDECASLISLLQSWTPPDTRRQSRSPMRRGWRAFIALKSTMTFFHFTSFTLLKYCMFSVLCHFPEEIYFNFTNRGGKWIIATDLHLIFPGTHPVSATCSEFSQARAVTTWWRAQAPMMWPWQRMRLASHVMWGLPGQHWRALPCNGICCGLVSHISRNHWLVACPSWMNCVGRGTII